MRFSIFLSLSFCVLISCKGAGGNTDPSIALPIQPAPKAPIAQPVPKALIAEPAPIAPVSIGTDLAETPSMAAFGERDPHYMPSGDWEARATDAPNTASGKSILEAMQLRFSGGLTLLHEQLRSAEDGSDVFEVVLPPLEVRAAWYAGWTGRGVNVLIADGFGLEGHPYGASDFHGYVVLLSVLAISRAELFAVNVGLEGSAARFGEGGVRHVFTNASGGEGVSFGVINNSFARAPIADAQEREQAVSNIYHTRFMKEMIGARGALLENIADAVITKAAGNAGSDAGHAPINIALVRHEKTKDRVLIVGALSGYVDGVSRQSISLALYSNFAGSDPEVARRFIVENGSNPVRHSIYIGDEIVHPYYSGTSYATPRVSGYVAIVRQKFPNLTATETTRLILETATYAGLACQPNCDGSIYGRGRTDIQRALAPVGAIN